ncbi:MAG TPA: MaoC/PaaZ C-terminal domain-containing protein [Acidimicrobiales bacterium]|jgi:acyl dehydratase|nr:MaoC/PaaZ C-terminal domain-containing protein [Acidimicrobiales bacterium]
MALRRSELEVGSVHEQVVVENLTRTQIVQYAGASGDYNPLHTDEVFATKVAGYPSVFAHGMLTMGLTGRMLTDYVGDGRLVRFGGRFRAQVWPGDDLTARAEITEITGENEVELVITTVNQDGAEVFTGTATARIDP